MKNEEIAAALWEFLWRTYVRRVPVARAYQEMIESGGGHVVLDHIAFRSLRLVENGLDLGLGYVGRVLERLDYQVAGSYQFPERHLVAQHYEHPLEVECRLPKIFVSELLVEELSAPVRDAITAAAKSAYDRLPSPSLHWLRLPEHRRLELTDTKRDTTLSDIAQFSTDLPWNLPCREVLEAVAAESLYAGWVLVHGFAVNHVAADARAHGAEDWQGIERCLEGLGLRGYVIKPSEIEGAPGDAFRQVGTDLVVEEVLTCDREGLPVTCPWPYAYFELSERGEVEGKRFPGFLESRATDLLDLHRPPTLGHAVD